MHSALFLKISYNIADAILDAEDSALMRAAEEAELAELWGPMSDQELMGYVLHIEAEEERKKEARKQERGKMPGIALSHLYIFKRYILKIVSCNCQKFK